MDMGLIMGSVRWFSRAWDLEEGRKGWMLSTLL